MPACSPSSPRPSAEVRSRVPTSSRAQLARLARGTGAWAAGLALTVGVITGCSSGSSSGPTPNPAGSSAGPAGTATPVSPPPATGSSGSGATGTPASTPVAPPSPGSVHSTVAPTSVPTKSPVRIDKPATTSSVRVQVTGQKSITSKAQGPGEVSGPAVALTFTVTNTGNRRLALSAVVINVADSAGNPASQMSASPARPFAGTLAAGRKATGVYVYNIAQNARGKIRIEVSVTPSLPTVVFVGKAI